MPLLCLKPDRNTFKFAACVCLRSLRSDPLLRRSGRMQRPCCVWLCVAMFVVLLALAGSQQLAQQPPLCQRLPEAGTIYHSVYMCLGVPSWALVPALWTPLSIQVNCTAPTVCYIVQKHHALRFVEPDGLPCPAVRDLRRRFVGRAARRPATRAVVRPCALHPARRVHVHAVTL